VRDPSIIDEDMNSFQREDFVKDCLDFLLPGNVATTGSRPTTLLHDLFSGALCSSKVDIENMDVSAIRRKLAGDSQANATGSPCNDGRLAIEAKHI
jgi:hypothetical protein